MRADVYLAGSLFTASERTWNSWLATELRGQGLQVCLPQEQVSAAVDPGKIDYEQIFRLCLEGLEIRKWCLLCLRVQTLTRAQRLNAATPLSSAVQS